MSLAHPWPENDEPLRPDLRGGAGFAALLQAEREVLDALAGAVLPPDVTTQLTEQLIGIRDVARAHRAAEADRVDGWRVDLPGRGNALFPPYEIDEEEGPFLRGRVTFTRFFLGGNAAAHGGALPLLFDDALGRVVNHGIPGVARTAYLTTNYRKITPMDVELTFDARRDRVDGRKRYASARLYLPDGTVCSDADGLFLELLPGQQ